MLAIVSGYGKCLANVISIQPPGIVVASHAGVFREARFSSLSTKRAPLKTPVWEARVVAAMITIAQIDFVSPFIIWLNPQAAKMKRILHSDWLPERARLSHPARSGFPALIPQVKVIFLATY